MARLARKNPNAKSAERWIEDQSQKFTLPEPKLGDKKAEGSVTAQVLNDYF